MSVKKEQNKETDMAEMRVKQFGKLVECIKETGRWIEENAEDIAPNVEHMMSMTIRVSIEPREIPTINIDYDAFSPEAARALMETQRRVQE